MKVLHVISNLNVGGAEISLLKLSKYGIAKGDELAVISLTRGGQLAHRFKENKIDILELDIRSKPISAIFQLIRFIKKYNPDVIQTWMYHSDLVGGVIGRLLGVKKVVWGIRNSRIPIGSRSTSILMKILSKLSFVVPHAVVAVAETSKKFHIENGYKENIFHVIPNGYDFRISTSDSNGSFGLKEQLGLKSQDILIGMVGRFHPDKGQDVFIKIAGELNHNFNNLKFILVGSGCEEANEELMKLMLDNNLQDNLILAGHQENVRKYLDIMDYYFLTSRSEAFPNSLVEAMGAKKNCIAFNVGDVEKLESPGMRMIKPGDIEGFAKEFLELYKMEPEERYRNANFSFKLVENNYSLDAMYKNFKSLYQQNINGAGE